VYNEWTFALAKRTLPVMNKITLVLNKPIVTMEISSVARLKMLNQL